MLFTYDGTPFLEYFDALALPNHTLQQEECSLVSVCFLDIIIEKTAVQHVTMLS